MFNSKLTLKKTHDFCTDKNPKLTVVCIHGIAANSSSFNKALQYLEGTRSLKSVRFIAFDLLGWGESTKNDKLKYNYQEQIEALHNSIEKLKLKTPLVLIGHSMGTFIVTRYANTYKKSVKQLILISAPVYTKTDLDSPVFQLTMKSFTDVINSRFPGMAKDRSFVNSMKYIITNRSNYNNLVNLKTPATLIYGDQDSIIASFNYSNLEKDNPKYISIIKTLGSHGITNTKYNKIVPILEKALND